MNRPYMSFSISLLNFSASAISLVSGFACMLNFKF